MPLLRVGHGRQRGAARRGAAPAWRGTSAALSGLRVGVLGLAFKPDTDDVRESPAIPGDPAAAGRQVAVKAYDPVAMPEARRVLGDGDHLRGLARASASRRWTRSCSSPAGSEFEAVPALLEAMKSPPLLVDGRRQLDKRDGRAIRGHRALGQRSRAPHRATAGGIGPRRASSPSGRTATTSRSAAAAPCSGWRRSGPSWRCSGWCSARRPSARRRRAPPPPTSWPGFSRVAARGARVPRRVPALLRGSGQGGLRGAQDASSRPDIIFTHYRDDRHQDHRLVSELTWNTWRNHLILEYEIPKYDGDFGSPNVFAPLTARGARSEDRADPGALPDSVEQALVHARSHCEAVARSPGHGVRRARADGGGLLRAKDSLLAATHEVGTDPYPSSRAQHFHVDHDMYAHRYRYVSRLTGRVPTTVWGQGCTCDGCCPKSSRTPHSTNSLSLRIERMRS